MVVIAADPSAYLLSQVRPAVTMSPSGSSRQGWSWPCGRLGERIRRTTPKARLVFPVHRGLRRHPNMKITHAAVPGTAHHGLSRAGQGAGLLVADAGRRLLYAPAGLDVPLRSSVVEQDEVGQVLEIRRSRSTTDRRVVLERRFAQITGHAP
ncbi:hypothetical protein [Streptosporangium sp. KLBMP 9127]|nr:hypothetical protein [Streptosporangium sp. KLBMP 9127]